LNGRGKVTSTVLKTEKSGPKMALVPIDELKPHEKGSPVYLELLKQEILRAGVLKYPIIADDKTRVILDGMHRWLVLKNLGHMLIPTILVDAMNDRRIRVGTRRIHRYVRESEDEVSIEMVLSAGLNGHLMKPRSTRHFFPFSKFRRINCGLNLLGKRTPQDISKYLVRASERECKAAVEEWLDEISEELEFLKGRTQEVEQERAEFIDRVKNMNNGFSIF